MGGNGSRGVTGVERFQSDYEDAPSQESMRGGVRNPRNPRTDQKVIRRRQQRTAGNEPRLEKCPHCHRQVEVLSLEHDGGHTFMTCPNCGHRSPMAGKEGSRMSNTTTVATLLREAAKAPSGAECARLVGEAERLRTQSVLTHESSRQLDLAGTEVRDRLTPRPVHELHTAATDWVGEIDTSGGEDARQAMIASATHWYGNIHQAVIADASEFRIQAEGMADRESGGYGENAETGRQSFLSMCATLRSRDVARGVVKEAEIVGDNTDTGMGAADVLGQNPPTGQGYNGMPGEATDSNRAPAFGDMSGGSEGAAGSVAGEGMAGEQQTPSPDPYHAASRRTASDSDNCDVCGKSLNPVEKAMGGPSRHTKCIPEGNKRDKTEASMHTANDGSMPEWLKEKVDDESDGDPDAPDPDKKKEGSVKRQALQGHVATCPNCHGVGRGLMRQASGQRVADCPSCAGFGGVARTERGRQLIAYLRREGYSGLHQLDEIADPKDDPSQTPYPTDQAFPMEQGGWANGQGQVQNAISETEQQIGEREQRKGASIEDRARWAANEAYRQVHAAYRPADPWSIFRQAGQDDSGWLGDMGAGGVGPGQQDAPPPGGNNLGMPDPVYGQGGDQPPGPRNQVGQDERNDRTNIPDGWQPGQPPQMDQAARGETLDNGNAPAFPDNGGGYGNSGGNQFQKGSSRSFDDDIEVKRARAFLASKYREYQGA